MSAHKLELQTTAFMVEQFTEGPETRLDSKSQSHDSAPKGNPTPPLWPQQLWNDNRQIFIHIVEHVFRFGLVMAALFIVDRVLAHIGLPEEKRKIFDSIDFYAEVILCVAFAVGFVVQLVVLLTKSLRESVISKPDLFLPSERDTAFPNKEKENEPTNSKRN